MITEEPTETPLSIWKKIISLGGPWVVYSSQEPSLVFTNPQEFFDLLLSLAKDTKLMN